MDKMLTIKEVQEVLNLSESTVYRLIREDTDFRTIKLGRSRRMPTSALEEWVEKQKDATA